MTPSLYDLLNVDPAASDAEIRAAWRDAIADLDPSDRRFRAYNQAAEVLLDPTRRAGYDAEILAADPDPATEPGRSESSVVPESTAGSVDHLSPTSVPVVADASSARWSHRIVPAWVVILLACWALASAGAAAYAWTRPHETLSGDSAPLITLNAGPEEAARAAQTAAESAAVAVLSYDSATLEDDQANAQSFMTSDYRKDYDKLFEVIKENAPSTQTKVEAEVIASGIVRSGEDRVAVLLFVNRPTTNKQQTDPVIYKDQVTVTMELVGDDWLVDDMETSPAAQ